MRGTLDKLFEESNQRLMDNIKREFRVWGREKPKKLCFKCNDEMKPRSKGFICKKCKKGES